MAFKAGAGRAEIVFPAEIFPIEGFAGVHDHPHIRVLLIESGMRAAIAAAELVNVSGEGLENIRRIVSSITKTAPSMVWVHITHAITTPHIPHDPSQKHAGPKNEHMDEIPPELAHKQRTLFLDALSKAASEAAEAAVASFGDAKLGCGLGHSNVNINRDVKTPFGWWVNLNPEGFSDKEMSILRIDNTEGQTVAVVVNYALKPCAIDNSQRREDKRLISSDVPGLASTLVEAQTSAVCLFLMGAAGDQVPREMTILDEVAEDGSVRCIDLGVENGLAIVQRLGTELAGDICRAFDAIECLPCSTEIHPARTSAPCTTKQRMQMRPRLEGEFVPEHETRIEAEMIALGGVAFVAAKPEINAITGWQLKKRSPFPMTLLLTMTNGEMKYMPDKASYEKLTWESQSSMLMPGAAETWLNAVIDALNKMNV